MSKQIPQSPPNQQSPQNQKQRQPTIDEQVSLLLGPLNRANNNVAREAENAVLQVISQLVVLKEAFDKLTKEHQDLKDEYTKISGKNSKNGEKNPKN